jgi:GxxExxY protein
MMNHQDTKAPRTAGPSELHDSLAREIVDGAFAVHSTLGPGLLESVYQQCLVRELKLRDLQIAQQVILPIQYRGITIDAGLRLDLIVGGLVIVEIKAVERLLPVHEAQLLTYLKLAQKRLGILVNFNVPLVKDGIRRLAL